MDFTSPTLDTQVADDTMLAMAGAHPKAVQAIMRHSTIVLTMDTYGHLFPGQEAETISRLPRMMSGNSAGESRIA
jgi:integrase